MSAAAERRRTKIVATIGPASRGAEVLEELIGAGVDVMRLNFAHASPDDHEQVVKEIRAASERVGREVGILGDLPGPKLRLGDVAGGVAELHTGDEVALTTDQAPGDASRLSVMWPELSSAVSEGDTIFLADGRVRLRALAVSEAEVRCRVEAEGAVASHQGVNLPGADEALPATGESDMPWVDFVVDQGIDLLAISFVRTRADLTAVEERLAARDADIPIIAKIEKPKAAENAEHIIRAADGGIMVARGDLGIEVPLSVVPILQKRLISAAGRLSKPSITATQMLASMVTSPRPTRAEVTDVANAIFDGTDAVMLSEETAVGKHPVEAVRVIDRIARETERELPYGEWLLHRTEGEETDVADSVAQGAVGATYRLNLAALVVPTTGGRTARLVSAHRPRMPVLAVSSRPSTVRRVNLLFGVRSVLAEEWTSLSALLRECAELARECGIAASGDLIAITAGLPEQELGTNLFEVHRVP